MGGGITGVYSIFDKTIKDQNKNYVVQITVHKDKGQAWTVDVSHDSGPVLKLSPTEL